MSFSTKRVAAQIDPIYTQYLNNMLILNPAYSGLPGFLNVTAISRQQWSGFDNSPTTNSIIAHSPMQSYDMGIGGSLLFDSYGPISQIGLYVDYAYRIRLNRHEYLSFGVKAGVNLYNANLSSLDIIDPDDPIFQSDIENKILPNFGIGFLWHGENFFVGASIPKLIQSEITNDQEIINSGGVSAEVNHYYIMGSYVTNLRREVQFKPSILLRFVPDMPFSFDVNAQFLFYEKLWAGVMYRYSNSFGLTAQFQISDQIKLGYALDLTTIQDAQYSAGTHEFMVSYDFNFRRKRRYKTPHFF